MYLRMLVIAGLCGLVLVACSGPQPLPDAPTPIPTLIPATLPPAGTVSEQAVASGEKAASTVAVPTVSMPAQGPTGQSPDTPEAVRTGEPPRTAEATPAMTAQPAAPSAALSNETFETVCVACHNLNAEKKVGPGLAGLFEREQLPNGKPLNDENLVEYIHTGGGAMPPFPNIEGEQLDELLKFLKEAAKR